ncbi:MAG: S26 family signal peptidase [Thermoplasmata archaeon]|nr:S26 family signal peptidase [Thermoplasmata archaeon]
MVRRGGSTDTDAEDPDLDEDELDDEEEEVEAPPPPRRRAARSRRSRGRGAVRPWTVSDLDDEEDDLAAVERDQKEYGGGVQRFMRFLRRPVFFRARDSWYFEPLVALAIIVLLLVSLFAYTSNWPPIFVVESGSMQHGSGDVVGIINTGDLVLVKKIDPSAIVPYVAGEHSGYSTYGEYGDVLLYHPNGDSSVTPVIHRAVLFLFWNATNRDFSAPALFGLPCGSAPNALYSVAGTGNGCLSTNSQGILSTVTLFHVGWQDASVSIPLGGLSHYSGFITMGDNNVVSGTPAQGEIDQVSGISALVMGDWVVGAARGMLPWVGSFKLLVDGNAVQVPPQSWQFLALTLSAIVLAGLGLHYLFRVEGIEDPRRLAEERAEADEEDEEAEEDDDGPEWRERPKGSRWKGLRAWLAAPQEPEEEPPSPRRHPSGHPHPLTRKRAPSARARGRPRPAVRKSRGLFHRRSERRSSRKSDDETL